MGAKPLPEPEAAQAPRRLPTRNDAAAERAREFVSEAGAAVTPVAATPDARAAEPNLTVEPSPVPSTSAPDRVVAGDAPERSNVVSEPDPPAPIPTVPVAAAPVPVPVVASAPAPSAVFASRAATPAHDGAIVGLKRDSTTIYPSPASKQRLRMIAAQHRIAESIVVSYALHRMFDALTDEEIVAALTAMKYGMRRPREKKSDP
jgi:hypothetical protein